MIFLVSTSAVYALPFGEKRISAKVTIEEARKIALKKIEGKIEDEYEIEDENEAVITYVFIIKNKEGKIFEVTVDAGTGEILSAAEDSEETLEDAEPPANAAPPVF